MFCLKKKQKNNLRFHVKQVAHSHISVALAVTISLCEELVLCPGHVDLLRPTFCFVIYGGVRCCVSVMDELGLEERGRERGEENQISTRSISGERPEETQ